MTDAKIMWPILLHVVEIPVPCLIHREIAKVILNGQLIVQRVPIDDDSIVGGRPQNQRNNLRYNVRRWISRGWCRSIRGWGSSL